MLYKKLVAGTLCHSIHLYVLLNINSITIVPVKWMPDKGKGDNLVYSDMILQCFNGSGFGPIRKYFFLVMVEPEVVVLQSRLCGIGQFGVDEKEIVEEGCGGRLCVPAEANLVLIINFEFSSK